MSANLVGAALGTDAGPALARVLAAVRRLATAAAIVWSGTLHAQAPSIAATQDIDRQIAERMARVGIVGLGAAIIVDRQVVWMHGFGFSDKDRTRPFTPRTVMNVGSIAKTVTGVAMMRAVQDGLLSLDEDINRYLPFRVVNPYRPQETITLRHLATHTSGIRDRWEVYARTYHYGGDSPSRSVPFSRSTSPSAARTTPGTTSSTPDPACAANTPTSAPRSRGTSSSARSASRSTSSRARMCSHRLA